LEKKDWHSTEIEDVLSALETSREGISDEEVAKRLQEYGPNELKEEAKKQWKRSLELDPGNSQVQKKLELIGE